MSRIDPAHRCAAVILLVGAMSRNAGYESEKFDTLGSERV